MAAQKVPQLRGVQMTDAMQRRKITLKKSIQDIQESVLELKKDFQESQIPITDDNQNLHRLCAKLEFLLQAELKAKTSLLGGKKDYWNYFCDCIGSTKGLNDGIKFVKSMSEMKTNLGKGRAFIRFNLVHQRLADSLQQCFINGKVTSDWYSPISPWLNHNLSSVIVNGLYDLNEVPFDLASRGYDLDSTWPTFARKTFGSPFNSASPYGAWNVPMSRTSSMSSLTSIPQEVVKTEVPLLSTSVESDIDVSQYQNNILQLEARNVELELKLEENILEKRTGKEKTLSLENEIKELQRVCNDLEVRNGKLTNELQLKEETWSQRELDLKNKISQEESTRISLVKEIEHLSHSSKDEVDSSKTKQQQLQESLQDALRQNAELNAKIVGLKLECDNQKHSNEERKDHVLHLEEKVSQLETKNVELMSKFEDVVSEKNQRASNDLQSADKIQDLLERVQLKEEENVSLRKVVSEAEHDIANLHENVRKLENGVSTIQKETEKLNLDFTEVQQNLQLSESDKEVLESSVNQLEQYLEENQTEKRKIEEQNELLEKEIKIRNEQLEHNTSSYKSKLCEENNEKVKLLEKIAANEKKHKDRIEELKKLRDEAENKLHATESNLNDVETELNQEIGKVKIEVSHLKHEKEQMSVEVDTQKKRTFEVETNLLLMEKTLGEQTSNVEEQYVKSCKVNQELSGKVIVLEGEIRTLSHQAKDLCSDNGLKEENIQTLKYDLLQKSTLVTDFETKLSTMESEIKQNAIAVQTKSSENEELLSIQKDLASKLTKKESKEKELQGIILSSKNECEKLLNDVNLARDHTSQLSHNLSTVSGQYSNLQISFDKLKEENCKLNVFKDKSTSLMNENEKLLSNVNHIDNSLLELKRENEELHCKIQSLTTLLSEKQLDIEQLSTKNDNLELDVSLLNSTKESEETVMEHLKQSEERNKTLQGDNAELLNKVTLLTDLVANHSNNIETLTQSNKEIRIKADRLENDYSEEKKKIEDDIREKEVELHQSNEKVVELEREKTDLCDENLELNRKLRDSKIEQDSLVSSSSGVDELQLKFTELVDERDGMKHELCKLTKDKEEALAAVKESTEQNATLGNILKEGKGVLADREKAAEDNRMQREQLEDELKCSKLEFTAKQLEYSLSLKNYATQESDIAKMADQMSEQETLVQSLELELHEIRTERELEKESQWKELEDFKQMMTDKEEECKLLHDSLRRTNLHLDDAKQEVLHLKNEFAETNKSHLSSAAEKEGEICSLKTDLVDLKKKLIKLIREKDSLWQKSDKLEFQQKLKATEKWVDSSSVVQCMGCKTAFSFTLRKHHCRLCGRVFCWKCCDNWVLATHSSKQTRVCNECHIDHSIDHGGNYRDDSGDIEESVAIPERLSSHWAVSTSTISSTSHNEINVVNPDDQPPDFSSHEGSLSAAVSAVDETLKTDPKASEARSEAGSKVSSDDLFDVITDEEIARSFTESQSFLSNESLASLSTSLQLSVEEIEKGQGTNNGDLWIKPGASYGIPVLIEAAKITLCWTFTTEPKSISFSVTYKERTDVPNCQEDILIPLCKVNSHKQSIDGELEAKQPGIYTLYFDNTSSRFTSKKLTYALEIRQAQT